MRKFILLSLITLTTLTSQAADMIKFTITGKTTAKSREITICNFATGKPVASVRVKDGTFTYTDKKYADTYLLLTDKEGRKQNLVITDGAEITLDMTKDQATGTPLNEELYSVAHHAYELQKKGQDDEATAYLLDRIEANKNNCTPVYWMYRFYSSVGHDNIKKFMSSDAVYAKHPATALVKQQIDKREKELKMIGTRFKDFKIPDLTGNKHKLSEYVGNGDYVLIDFWASWCKPCLSELPNIKANYERYHSKGFNVIGISLDQELAKCVSALGKYDIPWKTLSDLEGWNCVGALAYDLHSIPFSLLCDGNGNIVAVNLRGKALDRKLKEIYGE